MGEKFRPLEKRINNVGITRDEIFLKNSRFHSSDHERNEEILEDLKVKPVDENLRR